MTVIASVNNDARVGDVMIEAANQVDFVLFSVCNVLKHLSLTLTHTRSNVVLQNQYNNCDDKFVELSDIFSKILFFNKKITTRFFAGTKIQT